MKERERRGEVVMQPLVLPIGWERRELNYTQLGTILGLPDSSLSHSFLVAAQGITTHVLYTVCVELFPLIPCIPYDRGIEEGRERRRVRDLSVLGERRVRRGSVVPQSCSWYKHQTRPSSSRTSCRELLSLV